MENRPPGPDGTENSTNTHSNKAEHVAAWFQHRHDYDRHVLFANKAEKSDDDEDEEDEKGTGKKKAHHLRLGNLTVQGGDTNPGPKVESDDHSTKAEADKPDIESDQTTGDIVELPAESEHIAEELTSDMSDYEEDFEQWEQELAAQGPEAGSAEMQMAEEDNNAEDDQVYVPRQRTSSGASMHHQSRRHTATPRAASNAPMATAKPAAGSPPAAAAGGGGGVVPPMPPGAIPVGPSNPNGPNNPNAHNVFNSPNTLITHVTPNALTSTNPNKITDHEHEHDHPRLAAATLVGLLIERGFRRSADKRNEKASRKRDNLLREQIKDTSAMHEQARQKAEAQQLELANEQARQRRVLEAIRPTTNNVERPLAAGRPERGTVPQARVETAVQNIVDTELRQDIEQTTLEAAEAEARSRSKVVMEQVAVAAEFDEPVERVYERRQEVKDEPSNPGGAAGGASSIGSVLAKNGGAQRQSMHVSRAGQGGSTGDSHHDDNAAHHVDYRAAVIRGVGAGLAVIVLALLAYLLM